ncbi:MAG: glycine cleavage system aminomethyltransferase GcvT [Planctomycetota bacterium]
MSEAATELLKTPLHKHHVEAGAQMVEYAGWDMPLRYTSVQEEHRQVRRSGGMFDVSHMARFEFKGLHARRMLERLCTRRISDMQHGQARYTLLLNERGGVKDDALVYRLDDDEFMMVANGANRLKLLAHFDDVQQGAEYKVKLTDKTLKTAMVAMQGPKVMELISTVSKEVPSLKKYRFTVKNLMVIKLIVSRTGYTGEDGVEVILPSAMVDTAMKLLLKDVDRDDPDAVVKPIGLAARDTLRLEAGMPLYGHELSEERDALSSGLGFAMTLDKDGDEHGEAFIGLDALRAIQAAGGPKRRLVELRSSEKRTPRQGMPVLIGDEPSGEVTSGCQSPTLECGIAMAYVDAGQSEVGTAVEIDAGRARISAEIVPMPFYKAPKPS